MQEASNIDGTRHAVQLADAVKAGCFHHVSSIAAAGLYDGVFREDMFEEAEDLDHPYFRTKHLSEGVVRTECKRPWRIYRPGFVVGGRQRPGPLLNQLASFAEPKRKVVHEQDAHRPNARAGGPALPREPQCNLGRRVAPRKRCDRPHRSGTLAGRRGGNGPTRPSGIV